MAIEDTIVGAIVGGIIGIAGGLAVFLAQRLYDDKKEMKTLRNGLLNELEHNLGILSDIEKNPLDYLKGDIYNYLKSTAKIGKFGSGEALSLEKVFRLVQNINRDIDQYYLCQGHPEMVVRRGSASLVPLIKSNKNDLIEKMEALKDSIEKM